MADLRFWTGGNQINIQKIITSLLIEIQPWYLGFFLILGCSFNVNKKESIWTKNENHFWLPTVSLDYFLFWQECWFGLLVRCTDWDLRECLEPFLLFFLFLYIWRAVKGILMKFCTQIKSSISITHWKFKACSCSVFLFYVKNQFTRTAFWGTCTTLHRHTMLITLLFPSE